MTLFDGFYKYKKYLNNKPGIYLIKNTFNNKIYIGSSYNLYKRLHCHRSSLNKRNHSNKHLLNALIKYGFEYFEFKILKFTITSDKDLLSIEEQKYIDSLNPAYNIQPFAYINRGYKHTKEAIEKIKNSSIGRKTNNRSVLQYDLSGSFIKEWSSIIEVKRNLNINNNISNVCQHYESRGKKYPNRRTSVGFIWKYKEERKGVL